MAEELRTSHGPPPCDIVAVSGDGASACGMRRHEHVEPSAAPAPTACESYVFCPTGYKRAASPAMSGRSCFFHRGFPERRHMGRIPGDRGEKAHIEEPLRRLLGLLER